MGRAEDFRDLKSRMADREWRLDNLYWVQDPAGNAVSFVRYDVQRALWSGLWYLSLILKGRQLGFSTFIVLVMLDACLFNSNTSCGIIDYTLDDASAKLDKAKFAYDRLPDALKTAIPIVKRNEHELEFANGSSIRVGTSHRGGTLQILHVSEYGKISTHYPDKAREIKTGAFGTVHPGQIIVVESTGEGSAGDFYEMVQDAEKRHLEGRPLSLLSFKLHFFPWWMHDGYRLDPATVVIPAEVEEYVAELRLKHQIDLSREQIAWYADKRRQIGPDDILKEYPSLPAEPFHVAIKGAYFKREMTKMRADGRIGDIPHDENRKVNTWWDIGNDTTAIIFHQTDGVRHRIINYYENAGEQIGHYVKAVKRIGDENGYVFGKHLGPHDLGVTDWGGKGKTRQAMAAELGLEMEVGDRVDDKDDAIDAARALLNLTWIDSRKCERLIQGLDNYRKEWNERLGTWRDKPLHDWASHIADSYMTGAMNYEPEFVAKAVERMRHGRTAQTKSAWGM